MVRSRYWFTSISVQKKPYRSCTHSKYDTVTPPALHRMSGITNTPRANNSLSAPGGGGAVGGFRDDLGLDAVDVVHRDGVLERGGHQDVALQLQQVLIGDEIAAGEADHGAGLVLILNDRHGVEARAVVDAALGVADGQDAGAILVK